MLYSLLLLSLADDPDDGTDAPPRPAAAAAHQPEMIPLEEMDVVGHVAPPVKLTLRDGGNFDLAAYKGKVVVLSFWASWCSPCRQELPELAKLAKERTDIVFVSVNVDRTADKAEEFLAQTQVDLPIAMDSESLVMGQFNVMSMPTIFVIDRKGNVSYRKVGYSAEKGFTELLDAVGKAQ